MPVHTIRIHVTGTGKAKKRTTKKRHTTKRKRRSTKRRAKR
jgi:hypothetical protein